MSWVFKDWLTGLVSPLERFGDHFCFRWKNRKKQFKKSIFGLEGGGKWPKKMSKIDFFKSLQTLSPMSYAFQDRLRFDTRKVWGSPLISLKKSKREQSKIAKNSQNSTFRSHERRGVSNPKNVYKNVFLKSPNFISYHQCRTRFRTGLGVLFCL